MPQSPQLGYNHNIPHRGRLYHVQTEDSGASRGHIYTHIFFSGVIIGSNKVKYGEEAAADDFNAHVIGLMQDSHKSMILQLRRGGFDDKILTHVGEHPDASASTGADSRPIETYAEVEVEVEVEAEASETASPEPRDHTLPFVGPDEADGLPEVAEVARAPEPPPPPPGRRSRARRTTGLPLRPGSSTTGVDPLLNHPAQRRAGSGSTAAPPAPRGPRRSQRRAVGGIGGRGVSVGTPIELEARREIVVGKFASEHQTQLDEEILRLLGEEQSSP